MQARVRGEAGRARCMIDDGNLLIRDARLEEAGLVLDLWRVAFAEEDTRGDLDDLARIILDDYGARLLLAAVEGRPAASVIVTFDGWRGHMYRLSVLPAYRRQGIAGALVAAAEAWLASVGCHRIRLTVDPRNELGAAFWRAKGYVSDAESYVRRL